MNKQILYFTLLIPLVAAGCASTTDLKLSESHPGNPSAAQATYPKPAPFLTADTNLFAITTPSSTAPENSRGHQHDAKPKMEEKK